MTDDLRSAVAGFAAAVRRGKSLNVNDEPTKGRAISLASQYFNQDRGVLVASVGESPAIASLDGEWQALVRLAHGGNRRKTYLQRLRAISSLLSELSVASLARHSGVAPSVSLSADEGQILSVLSDLLPTAAASYRQALDDLAGPLRQSYRGTAGELREALRETLDHLAPDATVKGQQGYRPEEGQKGPTMKQKVRFVLSARGQGKTQRESTEKSVAMVEELCGDIARAVYNRASVATHTQESIKEVRRLKRYVDTVLAELLEIA